MSGALVPSKQEIPVEMQDEIFMQEESVIKVKNGKSKESPSKHHNGNGEEEEEGSNEEQVNENEVKKESATIVSEVKRDTETTKDSPQVTYYITPKNGSSPSAENTSNRNGDTKTVLRAETSNSSKTESNKGRYSGINGKNDGINYDAWRDLRITPSSTKPKDSDAKRFFKKAGGFVLKTAVISGVVIGGTAVALPLIGFGSLGPIAGSMAAAYQSSVGTVAAGSVFSTLQSVGMVGLSTAAKSGIVAGSAVISGAMSKSDKSDDGK